MLSDDDLQRFHKDLDDLRANMDQISKLVPLIFQTPEKNAEQKRTLDRLRREQQEPLGRVSTQLDQAEVDDLPELYRIVGERLYK